MNILIVDDEKISRETMAEILEEIGYPVVQCIHGLEALEYMHTSDVSLIISDINMPVMGGLELLKEITRQKADVDVILMTGNRNQCSVDEVLLNGACDLFFKPIHLEKLLLSIERVRSKHAPIEMI